MKNDTLSQGKKGSMLQHVQPAPPAAQAVFHMVPPDNTIQQIRSLEDNRYFPRGLTSMPRVPLPSSPIDAHGLTPIIQSSTERTNPTVVSATTTTTNCQSNATYLPSSSPPTYPGQRVLNDDPISRPYARRYTSSSQRVTNDIVHVPIEAAATFTNTKERGSKSKLQDQNAINEQNDQARKEQQALTGSSSLSNEADENKDDMRNNNTNSNNNIEDDDDDDADEKRRKRNREYARQSRRRKRQEFESLQEYDQLLREALRMAERQIGTLQEALTKSQQELEHVQRTLFLSQQHATTLQERLSRAEYDCHRLNAWIQANHHHHINDSSAYSQHQHGFSQPKASRDESNSFMLSNSTSNMQQSQLGVALPHSYLQQQQVGMTLPQPHLQQQQVGMTLPQPHLQQQLQHQRQQLQPQPNRQPPISTITERVRYVNRQQFDKDVDDHEQS